MTGVEGMIEKRKEELETQPDEKAKYEGATEVIKASPEVGLTIGGTQMVDIKELGELEVLEEDLEKTTGEIIRPKVWDTSTKGRCLDLVLEATVKYLEKHPEDPKAKYYKTALRMIAAELMFA